VLLGVGHSEACAGLLVLHSPQINCQLLASSSACRSRNTAGTVCRSDRCGKHEFVAAVV
jgi:hypothetical protein